MDKHYVLVGARLKHDGVATFETDSQPQCYSITVSLEPAGRAKGGSRDVEFLFPGNGLISPEELMGSLKKDKSVLLVAVVKKSSLVARAIRINQVDYLILSSRKLL